MSTRPTDKEPDIVTQLEFWGSMDSEELGRLISQAQDEIRGLRAELDQLRKDIEDASPRF